MAVDESRDLAVRARQLATVTDYSELHTALRARAEDLGVSRESLDFITGLPSGYVSKILSMRRIRRLGMTSLGPVCAALGVKLVVFEDPEAMAKYASRRRKRQQNLVRLRRQRKAAG